MGSKALYSLIDKTKLLFPSLAKRISKLHCGFQALPSVHRKLLPILSLTVIVLIILPNSSDDENNSAAKSGNNARKSIALTITQTQNVANQAGQKQDENNSTPAPPKIKLLDPENIAGEWRAHVIRKGDSAYRIFRQYKIPSAVLHDLLALRTPEQYITRARPGQIMSFYIATTGELIQLRITDADREPQLFTLREDGSYVYH